MDGALFEETQVPLVDLCADERRLIRAAAVFLDFVDASGQKQPCLPKKTVCAEEVVAEHDTVEEWVAAAGRVADAVRAMEKAASFEVVATSFRAAAERGRRLGGSSRRCLDVLAALNAAHFRQIGAQHVALVVQQASVRQRQRSGQGSVSYDYDSDNLAALATWLEGQRTNMRFLPEIEPAQEATKSGLNHQPWLRGRHRRAIPKALFSMLSPPPFPAPAFPSALPLLGGRYERRPDGSACASSEGALLGRGEFGEVFLGTDLVTGCDVALKRLPLTHLPAARNRPPHCSPRAASSFSAGAADERATLVRGLRELNLLRRAQGHPNIVKLQGALLSGGSRADTGFCATDGAAAASDNEFDNDGGSGDHGGGALLVLWLVLHPMPLDLQRLLDAPQPLGAPHARWLARQLLEALAH
jgi:hypothetical protein